ncbi:tRNA (guanosine(18)-2'-O)-methyltransferase [Mucinivorans hirudinis]|uniref:tRNA (Guanosine(18)-2'-O)-methyltransferase n=1 Tax=Mucinivorans hirudinis TaxID=1433126 RepID=A0A060RB70_9BACT|nr:tRNA (guanosine(18)-2'-O)-methyltransferase [Mucinivorans hirudinis]
MTKTEIQQIRALHSKEGRAEQGLFIAEGKKLVGDLLQSNLKIARIYRTGQIEASEMSRISALKTPTDTLALVEIPQWQPVSKGLRLVLDGVQDPGNLGTIIRIADWFGIGDVFCSLGSADCFNPKVVQATMGAIARVRVHYVDLTELLQGVELPIYGTFLEGENIYDTPLEGQGFVVMGSEGRGISEDIEKLITKKLYIPNFAAGVAVESLNVAVATAITCSEFKRRRL